MESVFEENPDHNQISGGWKKHDEDPQTLHELLNQQSLLEQSNFEGYIIEKIGNDYNREYAVIQNEVFQIVDNPKSKKIIRWLNVRFRRISPISCEKYEYGITIFGDQNGYDIFFDTQIELSAWMEFFTEYCVQLNLENYYQKIKEIGKGNYAKVYLAKEISTEEIVAIKSVLKDTLRESHRNISAIVQEVDAMRGLRHPYLCSLFAVFEDKNHVHLIIEYCPGGELFKRIIKRGKFSEYASARLTQNLLESMVYLHEIARVAHRDIKPENLMMLSFENDYEFKLADFGLATKFKEQNELILRCGSPGYVAPEILKNKNYGAKADIFSIGIILYIVLSGRSPFHGKQPQEVLIQNRDCKIHFQEKYWYNVSREAMHCVLMLTEPDPKLRPSAREALSHPWFQKQKIPSSPLVPANQISTPNTSIRTLSPGASPSSKLISREMMSRLNKKQTRNTVLTVGNKSLLNNSVSSPTKVDKQRVTITIQKNDLVNTMKQELKAAVAMNNQSRKSIDPNEKVETSPTQQNTEPFEEDKSEKQP